MPIRYPHGFHPQILAMKIAQLRPLASLPLSLVAALLLASPSIAVPTSPAVCFAPVVQDDAGDEDEKEKPDKRPEIEALLDLSLIHI